MSDYYQKTAKEVCEEFSVKPEKGLSIRQAKDRLQTFGPNILAQSKKILVFAAALVLLFGQSTDALVILAVIILNAIVGTIQEGRAKNSLERLKKLIRHKAVVRRDSEEMLIASDEVAPGDVLILHEGDRIAADARLIKAESLTTDESILTGEAYTVAKNPEVLNRKNLVIGDQKNMVFAGTSIASGYGEAVVVATGFDSELGKISKDLLETADIPLPLTRKIVKLTHFIAWGVLAIAFVVLLIGLVRGIALHEIITAVIGLSVSVVPEGLPVAVTVVLAKGVWRMAKARAIVRQMAAVEAMGNADTLLVDKTGTLTTGQMIINKIYFGKDHLKVAGEGYQPEGKIEGGTKESQFRLKKVLSLTYLSLKADVIYEEGSGFRPIGDPTEAAIAVVCRKFKLSKDELEKEYKTIIAKPFDSKKRYIEAKFENDEGQWDIYVGAPEFLSRDLKIDHELTSDYQKLTEKGLRVVGVAVYGPSRGKLYGWLLLAIDEEIRQHVARSIAQAKKAGLRVVMMTGDFPKTAQSIAREIGIFEEGDMVLTGEDVEKLPKAKLLENLQKVSVFARITPQHKHKIVELFKEKGHVVAMTGDGVNDAPALQAANLGIGLGSGTQVAKDASDIVLTDNDFSTITQAIAEGRNIYLTLKKVILYLFSTSLGEVGFFVVALAQEPPENGLRSREEVGSENLVDSSAKERILLMALAMFVATISVFVFAQKSYSLDYARSLALVILSVSQWLNAFNVRSRQKSVFSTPVNNAYLLAALVIVFVLQILAIQTNFGNALLHTQKLSLTHWLLAFGVSTIIIWVEEARKLMARANNNWPSFVKYNT
ncbi:MAG: Cation-transporting ATPase, E1-E2 family [Candidatus Curtissbacteria bacterium GW2011_GWA1_40_47]|nr:MAG: Cation-transporting ATPase, E1-E2 family [Candidatus Curtissbacteria bacterium GW2011_GWA1_40_47]